MRSQGESKRQIGETLTQREDALKTKSIDMYMGCISMDYCDDSKDYRSLREEMLKTFKTFDEIDFSHSNQTIYLEKGNAMVVQEYVLSFRSKDKRDHIRGKEKIFLKREGDAWKIIKGL